ncbi:hypothetical protein, partial [Escherichia coli]|uniref:hypothetical protein n=1 Tax=Escherichia coli TaxID=562 RepID=UPI001BA99F77
EPCSMAPDDKHDLISGTCSHLPKQKLTDAGLKLMTTAKMPDALRLSGLRHLCNILNLRAFVGRIRRSRRIRHE